MLGNCLGLLFFQSRTKQTSRLDFVRSGKPRPAQRRFSVTPEGCESDPDPSHSS